MPCLPRWATPRREDRRSRGGEVGAVARLLGQPLMPWQQMVADVGLEVDADGRPFWREVIITVPRQSGKSTLTLSWQVHRALRWGKPQRIAYTAQTGWDARKKLIDDFAPTLLGSSLAPAVDRVTRGAGNESILFKGSSRIDVLASTEAAGHGRTLDMAVLDEMFADTDDRREQSMIPAMATKRDAQILGVSTEGTDTSVLLNRKVEAGRASVASGAESGIAYFEWSIGPDDDPADESIWPSFMPALGITIDASVVRHARATMSEGEFLRSFCNRRTTTTDRVIPADAWEAVSGDVGPSGRLVFGVAVHSDRSSAAIAVADADGRCELVDHRAGVGWVADRVVELWQRWRAPVAVDVSGPAGVLAEALELAGVEVRRMSGRDAAMACAGLFDAVMDRTALVRRHTALDNAVAGARRKVSGDLWTWARGDVGSDVSPLEAVTLAFDRARNTKPAGLWASWA